MKKTIMEEFAQTVERFGDKPALMSKKDGEWTGMTWKQYDERIRITARAFMALGLEPGKAVSIMGYNCPQWVISDLAAIFAGAVPGGIYTTNSPDQCEFIAGHSEANIAVLEDALQLVKFKKIRRNLPELKAIVLMNGSDNDDGVYSWDELDKLAESVTEQELDERINAQKPDDCCTLIYTSGTTGNPKGVMISHDNVVWTAKQVRNLVNGTDEEHLISYLPLSHIAEQMVSLHGPYTMGCTTWFAESIEKYPIFRHKLFENDTI